MCGVLGRECQPLLTFQAWVPICLPPCADRDSSFPEANQRMGVIGAGVLLALLLGLLLSLLCCCCICRKKDQACE